MSQSPSHGHASNARAGNARENFQVMSMDGSYSPGMAGGLANQLECHFPQAPPMRSYCHPAAFSSLNGASHHRLGDAYGKSVVSRR